MHELGSYKPEDLNKVKEYKALVTHTAKIFNTAVQDNDIPAAMLNSLKNDIYLFSGLRTHAELFEASRQLLSDDGQVKGFSQFSRDIAKIKANYNQTYLDAEYNFALTSAQMAGQWAALSPDYNLQYRTAADERVRDTHAALHDITLPVNDPFWLSYYPPNGWGCRCDAVQVLKSKYEESNPNIAITRGEAATSQIGKDGKNRLEIFRFNPGAQKVVFPPNHPYNKVSGADVIKENVKNGSFKVTPDILKEFDKREIYVYEKGRGIEFFNENFKGFDFIELDKNINEIAQANGFKINQRNLSFYEGKVNIEYRAKDGKFTMVRSLYLDGTIKTVSHDLLMLNSDLQGGGLTKNLFKQLYKQYQSASLQQIEVHANIDIGGYAWGKYGFSAIRKLDVDYILEGAERLAKRGDLTKLELDHFKGLYKNHYKVKDAGPFPMHDIAQTSYGKKVLLGSDWYGTIDLKNNAQRQIFEDYLLGK